MRDLEISESLPKRTMSQITIFDFVLLLVVAEATQQGLLGDYFSLTSAAVAAWEQRAGRGAGARS